MIIPINIYSQDLTSQFALTQRDVDDLISGVIGQLSKRLYVEWENEAKQRLKGTKTEYIRSLKYFTEGPLSGGVMLVGVLPNMIESGAEPFDMKAGFLASPKVKTGKSGGRYLTILFRYASAGSVGESSAFSGVLPASVEKVVKAIGNSRKKVTIPSPYDTKKTRMRIETPKGRVFEEYHHKNSIYEGVTRQQKTYHKASGSQYMVFRRVSDKSDGNSWIHPGFIAYGLAESAVEKLDIPQELGYAIDEMLLKMGFGD